MDRLKKGEFGDSEFAMPYWKDYTLPDAMNTTRELKYYGAPIHVEKRLGNTELLPK